MIVHLMQPTNSSCVQTCVAMLLGHLNVDEVFKGLPSKKSGTKHKALIAYLHQIGVPCNDRLTVLRSNKLPELAFVRISWGKRWGHFVLKVGNTWHDPELTTPFTGTLPPERSWYGNGRVTSYLEVKTDLSSLRAR